MGAACCADCWGQGQYAPNNQREYLQGQYAPNNQREYLANADGRGGADHEAALEEQMLQQALLQSRLEAQGRVGGLPGAAPYPGGASPGAPLMGGAAPYRGGSPAHFPMGADPPLMGGQLGEVEEQEAMLAQIRARTEQEQLSRAMSASLGQDALAGQAAPESEEDQLRRALTVSKQEEDARQRRLLREQQRAELEESLRIDRERDAARQRAAAGSSAGLAPQATAPARTPPPPTAPPLSSAAASAAAASQAVAPARGPPPPAAPPLPSAASSAAAATPAPARPLPLPPEPAREEPGQLEVLVRLPDGRRLRRAFHQQNLVGDLYNFTEGEGGGALAAGGYQLVSTMPRRVFSDRGVTLAAAGLAGSCALLVEATDT